MIEHLDVLIVGAGLSGVGAGYFIQHDCPWAEYAIFESREAIGGTWDLFKYPGLRSDSDMFTLGYSFRPWDGEQAIADGSKILDYIKDTARETGVESQIRFNHRIVKADWSTADAHWLVTALRTDTNETFQLSVGFIFSCTGYYRYDQGYTPEFAGRDRFTGQVVHPQQWPEDFDHAGKKIVVIGSGATAITLIPSLADTAAHVTMLQRSPTYVAAVPSIDPLANLARRLLPSSISGPVLRWIRALGTQATYQLSHWRPEMVKKVLRRQAVRNLPEGYPVDTHFAPKYNPWQQRLCADSNGMFFKAISDGRASVVTDQIDTFTEKGILLRSGQELEADVIITATGLDLLFMGGMELSVDGAAVVVNEKLTYKGMMLDGVPNFAIALGYTNASWTLKVDLTAGYVTRLLNHLRAKGLRQCAPDASGAEATDSPALSLMSGYILRVADRLPRQGTTFPWKVTQSYLADYRAMKKSRVDDDVMQFSNPVRATETVGS